MDFKYLKEPDWSEYSKKMTWQEAQDKYGPMWNNISEWLSIPTNGRVYVKITFKDWTIIKYHYDTIKKT